jgi:Leucine Rich Repeat
MCCDGDRVLDLSHNQLRGGIPKSLEELVQLTKLHLNSNELGGPLEPFLFHFPVLRCGFV